MTTPPRGAGHGWISALREFTVVVAGCPWRARGPGVVGGSAILAPLLLFACLPGEAPSPTLVLPLDADSGPAISLTIRDRNARFALDTGAGTHTLARWFAERAGLIDDSTLVDDFEVLDATGTPVAVRVVSGVVGVLDGGDSLEIGSAIVTDFPSGLEQEGIGGLLSPQLLAMGDKAAVLDLRVGEFRIEPFVDALGRLGGRPVPGARVEFCTDPSASLPNLAYAVSVETRGSRRMMGLDTGADATVIFSESELIRGIDLESGGESVGVAGQPRSYSLARDVPISFAGNQATVDARVADGSGEGCGSDGRLGIDALGSCALVLGRTALAVECGS